MSIRGILRLAGRFAGTCATGVAIGTRDAAAAFLSARRTLNLERTVSVDDRLAGHLPTDTAAAERLAAYEAHTVPTPSRSARRWPLTAS